MKKQNSQDIAQLRQVNKAMCAEFFEVSLPTIEAWIRRGCPVIKKGDRGIPWTLDLLEVIRWRFEEDRAQHTDPEKMPPDRRLKHYQAEKARDELIESRKLLIPAPEVLSGTAHLIGKIVEITADLPQRLDREAQIGPHGIDVVERLLTLMRKDLHEKLETLRSKEISSS